ncbi:RelA/SpoT family protein [Anaerorhabdus furcosa]|uniref:GTP diphosphokinase n=1 Tax=Anaerorhabdus furcosa TaxID=118967 RepID=A0A1T4P174_9FIRM|nr:bifunctional (p)ppGpp synthetase/guanosine-3',5'-bis(diphosphate) 3'-pyrophosphohydrolase [Anaerorhabdus furcosa]SJZ85006.1 GTP pyrophosphokinase [Anaerorhabdus furcosa]
MATNTTKIITKDDILTASKEYIHNEDSLKIISKSIDYATEKHEGQFRKSGEPYIIHALNVGYILAILHCGPRTIAAGLLHDVLEDCDVPREELVKQFDEEVTGLVESVTKIGNIQFKDEKEYLAANHRKIFIAMARDIRVILIKLVDRLHNMRTLQYMPEEKQKRIAAETLEVYAPIAHRLGISEIKNELEDLSFFYLDRDMYYQIAHLVEAKKAERDEQVKHMIQEISELLTLNKIEFRIFGRSKHLYSIYKKMKTKGKRFEEILDLLAIRIVTKTELNCYEILGHIHATYRPIPGRLKDYVAMPKMNMYQSLHTTIVGDEGRIFEVQIRTENMDSIAEQGVAAHWRYKEGSKYDSKREQKEIEQKLTWFKDFANLTSDQEDDNPVEYMDRLQKDVFEANVYVMTPNGRVIDLPNGSTPIDFAYRVHTEVGHACVGAIVNETLVPLNTVLKTGDVVQIRTSKQFPGPSEDWLKVVKTNQAKSKIKSYLMRKEVERRQEKVDIGEGIIRDELRKRGFDDKEYMEKKKIEGIFQHFQVSNYIDFMYAVAVKSISPQNVVEKLTNQKRSVLETNALSRLLNKEHTPKKTTSKSGLKVSGVDSMMMSLAGCCNPVYGDEIIGYITKGQGVKVHRKDCPNIQGTKSRLIEVEWDDNISKQQYEANLTCLSHDRNFLITDIVTVVSQCKANLMGINSVVNSEDLTATTKMNILVDDIDHLQNVIANLKKVNSVISVERQIL